MIFFVKIYECISKTIDDELLKQKHRLSDNTFTRSRC